VLLGMRSGLSIAKIARLASFSRRSRETAGGAAARPAGLPVRARGSWARRCVRGLATPSILDRAVVASAVGVRAVTGVSCVEWAHAPKGKKGKPRPKKFPSSFEILGTAECSVEVRPQILDSLDSHAQSKEAVTDVGKEASFARHRRVCR
jgi:hypothetical protein